MPQSTHSPVDPDGLDVYFTDVEYLREIFRASLATPALVRRLFVVYGVGGVGKTSLLRMFRLDCKSAHIPVALASGDEAKSAVEVLSHWSDDLGGDRVALPIFIRALRHYRAIQAKVHEQARKAQDAWGKLAGIAGKAAPKIAEAAGGAAAGALIGSVVPGIGTVAGNALGGIAGGIGTEAIVDWLRGFLPKQDVDLLFDPTRTLSDAFLNDVAKTAPTKRMVLILDAFEQAAALDKWTCDLARQLHPNLLLVIAGREMVDWDRWWPGWLAQTEVHALEPMNHDAMRELVWRYYAMYWTPKTGHSFRGPVQGDSSGRPCNRLRARSNGRQEIIA